ncbi:hypothetical protein O6H91_04G020000 [Diphasiastrum complanatum]|uniref:Uncharacterized protein n=2 Tax=Diphasiastrum complanatum TaxID=34168 RepID=A0ACC2DVF9_DIPCM|nr:hypothetical protein O6H91_07G064500 [Diphasiastrum complanatum]KAJ7557987.1 hypothetical protein O6H91_04G020000 [Diphasiastrum complanatum]
MFNDQLLGMPGFRFHPTDHELLDFYLRKMVEGKLAPGGLIRSVDFCSHDPWELPGVARTVGAKESFFFVPRVSKKLHVTRPSRVTPSGYWKATGSERIIRTLSGKCLGRRKTLVFYEGRAPKGLRTNWVMQEYRLPENDYSSALSKESQLEFSLCRVYTKASSAGYTACQQKVPRQTILEDFSGSAQGHPLCGSENATTFRRNLLSTKEWTKETSTAAYAEHKGEHTASYSPIQHELSEGASTINAKLPQNHSPREESQSEEFELNSTTESQQTVAQEREGSEKIWEFCMDERHALYMSNWDEPFDILGSAIPESSSSGSPLSYVL